MAMVAPLLALLKLVIIAKEVLSSTLILAMKSAEMDLIMTNTNATMVILRKAMVAIAAA